MASTSDACPDPLALDLFIHELAYRRTEEVDPLRNLPVIHVGVWQRGLIVAFYVQERLNGGVPKMRDVYEFSSQGMKGGYECPAAQDWRKCVENGERDEAGKQRVRTCIATIARRNIPPWAPSPNDLTKRLVARQLRNEIETKWPGVREIVVRDFNLSDNRLTMYLKMPDGDYFQGCGFWALREMHCYGWHLFGQAPLRKIREWIFAKPYRLK